MIRTRRALLINDTVNTAFLTIVISFENVSNPIYLTENMIKYLKIKLTIDNIYPVRDF